MNTMTHFHALKLESSKATDLVGLLRDASDQLAELKTLFALIQQQSDQPDTVARLAALGSRQAQFGADNLHLEAEELHSLATEG